MPVVVRRLGRLLILGMSAGCAWSNGGAAVHSGHTPAPTEACVPASWACGAVVRIDARSGAARWQVDTNGDVNSVVAGRRGGVFIAGGFTRVGGARRPYIAHVFADGRLDTRWQPRVWSRASVRGTQPTLALGRGRLFAVGLTTNPKRPTGIVAISARTGVVDRHWGVGIRIVDGVAPVAVAGRRLYVGAALVRGHTITGSVALLDATTGAFDPAFHTPILNGGEGTGVNTLAVAGRRLYVGGQYESIDRVRLNGLSVLDAGSGRLITSWRPRLSRCGVCVQASLVYGVAVGAAAVYVATAALRVDGGRRYGVALLNPTTAAVQPWSPRLAGNAEVVIRAGNRVYIGGDFTKVNDMPRRGLAALDPRTGRLLPSWQPSTGTSAVLSLSASANSVFAGTVLPAAPTA
jgi:hypothetical protein